MSFGAYYSGALTHLFFANPKTDLAPIVDAATKKPNLDLLMPFFITTYVPTWLVLVILLMVFSASMSSLSSLVLVSSSAIAIDIYGASVKREEKQKQIMLLMRVLCAVFVALSLLIAVSRVDVIVNLMVIAWGALSGAFLAPVSLRPLLAAGDQGRRLCRDDLRSRHGGRLVLLLGQASHPRGGRDRDVRAAAGDARCQLPHIAARRGASGESVFPLRRRSNQPTRNPEPKFQTNERMNL